MKILFAGTPLFSVPALQSIARQHDVVGVFTQPDRRSGRGKKVAEPAVKTAAKSLQLEIHQPPSLRDQTEFISELAPDVMVVVAYGVILPQTILDIPKHGCLNIHASLLPRWRGAAPIHRAIEAGDKQTGICIMQMEAGLDTGPVMDTYEIDILSQDTSSSLHDKLSNIGADRISAVLARLENGETLKVSEQNNDNASYANKISKTEAQIDWSQPADVIERRVRAFNAWPIMQTHHHQTRLRVWEAKLATDSPNKGSPGEVLSMDEHGLYVACGSGVVQLRTLQRDGSKPMPYKAFRNGYQISVKDILG